MTNPRPIYKILTAVFVVFFGWGSMYLISGVIRNIQSSTLTKQTLQKTNLKASAINSSNNIVNNQNLTPIPAKNENKSTIMIGGDIMFDRSIRALGEKNGYDSLFDDSVISLFKKADIVAANLEGPITSYSSKTLINNKTTNNLVFTFSPQIRLALTHAGITIVSLANNHTDNFGFLGFIETQDWLKDSGISWFGNPWNSTSTKMSREKTTGANSPVTTLITENDITVAFVGYHSFQLGVDRIIAEIKRVSGPDIFTIVMPHWGDEYIKTPTDKMKSYTKSFVTAGADAIIGAHSHIIGDNEWIDTVPIYYSIGNLLFDQYFSPEVMRGNIVELQVIKDSTGTHLDSINVHDVYLNKDQGVSLEK